MVVGGIPALASADESLAVLTDEVRNVQNSEVDVDVILDDLGGAETVDVSVEYGPEGTGLDRQTDPVTLYGRGVRIFSVTGLSPGTAYEFRPRADASDGSTDTGSVVTATTVDEPEVELTAQGGPTDTTLELDGVIHTLIGPDSVEGFFEYREAGASAWNESARQTLTSAVEYTETVTGLSEETTYEWRAVVETPDGHVFNTVTRDEMTTGDPVAETDRADDVDETSATLVGSLNDLGGADEAQAFFEYGTGGDLSNETAAETLTGTDFNTGGSAIFSHEVTGLSTGETYEFRAVADASDGETATGSVLSFTPGSDGGGGGETPAIDQFDVTVNTSYWGDSVNVDWAVSDGDGDADLSSVTTALRTDSGSVLVSDTTDVSGSDASGSDHHGLWAGGEEIEITVTDADGNETTDVKNV